MLTDNFYKEYNFINQVSNGQLDGHVIEEIRLIKVFKKTKIKYINSFGVFSLLFSSNDFVEYNSIEKDNIIFYSIKTKEKVTFIIGILIEYLNDGTKKETIVFNKKTSSFFNLLLTSKYNSKWKQPR